MSLDITPVTVTGTWWRHLPAGGDPAYRSDPPASGRWQRGDTVAALYLASDEETCWAEWYRRLVDDAVAPLDALPRDLWRYAVALDGVAALDTEERLAAVGLAAPRPSRADWPAYQAVGERLWGDGHAGVLFASVATTPCALRLTVRTPSTGCATSATPPGSCTRRAPCSG